MNDADGGDDGGKAGEVGDGGADDEGEGPVDGYDSYPEEFAVFMGEGWGPEEFDANVIVKDWCGGWLARIFQSMMEMYELTFNANIAVQACCDKRGDHG